MNFIKSILVILFITATYNVTAQTVYTTKSGEKYHDESCRYLKYSQRAITLEKALEIGYSPCSVCKPPSTTGKIPSENSYFKNNSATTTTTTTKSTATQCAGKTQSGARCKRMTKNANGRCYQHAS